MKHILQFVILLAFSVCAQAQFQYRPTSFTAPFVSTINSQAAAQTYLGIGSSTNNALLNGTNVFTGTNTFSSGKLAMEGYPLFTYRVLFSTNIGIINITNTSTINNHIVDGGGGFATTTPLIDVRLPAVGTNAKVGLMRFHQTTNANIGTYTEFCYVGDTTNWVNYINQGSATAYGPTAQTAPAFMFSNYGSHTNQYPFGTAVFSTIYSSNRVDTSTNNWRFMLGGARQDAGGVGYTNLNLMQIMVVVTDYP